MEDPATLARLARWKSGDGHGSKRGETASQNGRQQPPNPAVLSPTTRFYKLYYVLAQKEPKHLYFSISCLRAQLSPKIICFLN